MVMRAEDVPGSFDVRRKASLHFPSLLLLYSAPSMCTCASDSVDMLSRRCLFALQSRS